MQWKVFRIKKCMLLKKKQTSVQQRQAHGMPAGTFANEEKWKIWTNMSSDLRRRVYQISTVLKTIFELDVWLGNYPLKYFRNRINVKWKGHQFWKACIAMWWDHRRKTHKAVQNSQWHLLTIFSDMWWYISLQRISKSSISSRSYKPMIENQLNAKIIYIRNDNGGEYFNRRFLKVCQSSGIIHQTTIPYWPQQNGLAKRMNRKFMERAISMINYMQVDKKWWAEAVNTALCITNRVPCAAHPNKTPHEICLKIKPKFEYLRVPGGHGLAYVHTFQSARSWTKGVSCMYIGYSNQTKRIRVWNLDSERLEYTRSSNFQEHPQRLYVRAINRDALEHHISHDFVSDDEEGNPLVPVIPLRQGTQWM